MTWSIECTSKSERHLSPTALQGHVAKARKTQSASQPFPLRCDLLAIHLLESSLPEWPGRDDSPEQRQPCVPELVLRSVLPSAADATAAIAHVPRDGNRELDDEASVVRPSPWGRGAGDRRSMRGRQGRAVRAPCALCSRTLVIIIIIIRRTNNAQAFPEKSICFPDAPPLLLTCSETLLRAPQVTPRLASEPPKSSPDPLPDT